MPNHLCLTITFLDPRFHGRRDGGEPEWPPSPLRLFQAIVAAAAAPTGRIGANLAASLRWFEALPPPRIVAPVHCMGEPYRLSVPNNAMDLVVKAWAKGNYDGSGDANPATHRTMKTVRPTHMVGSDQVRYIWTLPDPLRDDDRRHAESIRTAVRAIVALGWGVDLVVGHGELTSGETTDGQVDGSRVQWEPRPQGAGTPLRAPKPGTFEALLRRHNAFQNRVTDDGFVPVPPLTTFSIAKYHNARDVPPRPFAAFALRHVNPDDRNAWRAFRIERTAVVAAMVRHAACRAAKADLEYWESQNTDSAVYVAGHTGRDVASRRGPTPQRFSYLPFPSIGHTHADGMIRRVLIASPHGGDPSRARWATERLAGAELIDEDTGEAFAVLEPLGVADNVLRSFTQSSRDWITVTPMVLPGYDGLKMNKAQRLLSRACDDAGLPPGSVDSFEFVGPPSYAGSTGKFFVPNYLRGWPLRWVVLRFKHEFRGPISIGAGRHCGLGVFAALTPRA